MGAPQSYGSHRRTRRRNGSLNTSPKSSAGTHMASEALGIDRPRTREKSAPEGDTLTRRASLNVLQSLLDYSVKLGVGLLIVPLLVTGLGRTMFGIWEMLGRLTGYIESTDGRSTQALRLMISNQQGSEDHTGKRRLVGSALVV